MISTRSACLVSLFSSKREFLSHEVYSQKVYAGIQALPRYHSTAFIWGNGEDLKGQILFWSAVAQGYGRVECVHKLKNATLSVY